ncbi:hypothetical protein GCM10027217_01900 [Pseudomaricurvus hydrocarbonicus]
MQARENSEADKKAFGEGLKPAGEADQQFVHPRFPQRWAEQTRRTICKTRLAISKIRTAKAGKSAWDIGKVRVT